MPRRYYRSRKIYRYPKRKWATRMTNQNGALSINADTQLANRQFVIVNNSQDIDSPTPTIVKCGNPNISIELAIQLSAAGSTDATAFLIYTPELALSNDADFSACRSFIEAHPEYIMAWKRFDGNSYSSEISCNTVILTSRLKRNLNTNDRLRLIILASCITSGVHIVGTRYAITGTINTCNN